MTLITAIYRVADRPPFVCRLSTLETNQASSGSQDAENASCGAMERGVEVGLQTRIRLRRGDRGPQFPGASRFVIRSR